MRLSLNHFSVRCRDLAASRAFYEELLGLRSGPRPPFPFPGLWLYAGEDDDYGAALVHLIGVDPQDTAGLTQYLGERAADAAQPGTGALDHIAFSASGLAAMRARLRARGLAARERSVPLLGLQQLFVQDPDGVVIELNYPAGEAEPAG